MYKNFKNELIHDNDVLRSISYMTICKYERLLDELKDIKESGYAWRNGNLIEGSELKKLIEKINVEKELLEYLLKDAEKYRTINS